MLMIDPIRKFLRNYKKAKTEIKRVRLEKLLSVPYMWLFLNFEERNIYNHSPFRFIQLDQHESSYGLSLLYMSEWTANLPISPALDYLMIARDSSSTKSEIKRDTSLYKGAAAI